MNVLFCTPRLCTIFFVGNSLNFPNSFLGKTRTQDLISSSICSIIFPMAPLAQFFSVISTVQECFENHLFLPLPLSKELWLVPNGRRKAIHWVSYYKGQRINKMPGYWEGVIDSAKTWLEQGRILSR